MKTIITITTAISPMFKNDFLKAYNKNLISKVEGDQLILNKKTDEELLVTILTHTYEFDTPYKDIVLLARAQEEAEALHESITILTYNVEYDGW